MPAPAAKVILLPAATATLWSKLIKPVEPAVMLVTLLAVPLLPRFKVVAVLVPTLSVPALAASKVAANRLAAIPVPLTLKFPV